MGYTNTTTHYLLPQYVATDKPKYLTDFNETMVAIDTQMYTNAQAVATADGKAVAAKEVADGAVSSIGTLNEQINGDPQDPTDTGLNGQVSDNKTDIETMQSLIGNGTPTTSNQTIIGAINGLEGAVAPREDGADLANNYTTGQQFARGGSIFTALTDLTFGTAFASLTLNTDYKVSDTLVEQIADVAGDVNDIKSDLNGKTLISNVDLYVRVTADGVKTLKDLLSELGSAMVTACQALDDGYILKPVRISGSGIGANELCISPYTHDNTATAFEHTFNAIYFSDGKLFMRSTQVSSTLANCYSQNVTILAADNTVNNHNYDSDVIENTKVIDLHYELYKVN